MLGLRVASAVPACARSLHVTVKGDLSSYKVTQVCAQRGAWAPLLALASEHRRRRVVVVAGVRASAPRHACPCVVLASLIVFSTWLCDWGVWPGGVLCAPLCGVRGVAEGRHLTRHSHCDAAQALITFNQKVEFERVNKIVEGRRVSGPSHVAPCRSPVLLVQRAREHRRSS
jgi:hypothetical protein